MAKKNREPQGATMDNRADLLALISGRAENMEHIQGEVKFTSIFKIYHCFNISLQIIVFRYLYVLILIFPFKKLILKKLKVLLYSKTIIDTIRK